MKDLPFTIDRRDSKINSPPPRGHTYFVERDGTENQDCGSDEQKGLCWSMEFSSWIIATQMALPRPPALCRFFVKMSDWLLCEYEWSIHQCDFEQPWMVWGGKKGQTTLAHICSEVDIITGYAIIIKIGPLPWKTYSDGKHRHGII